MKKRLTLLSLLLLFTMTAMAQTLVDGIYYNLNGSDNTVEVTSGTKYSGDIVIPASISVGGVDYSVTTIGDKAFSGCSGLTSIEIPNSVTEIGTQAFYNCSGLTSIEIPNSVTSIGDDAFEECSNLTSIKIPTSVTSIGDYPFFGCSGLTSIVVEEGNSYYDSRENCNAIIETASNKLIAGCQNTVIPTSVILIGDEAFTGCSGLTSIEIPNSVTLIQDYVFYSCSELTSITMQRATPPTVAVSEYLFYECSKLETIYVPAGAVEAYNVAPWNAYNIVESTSDPEPQPVEGKYYILKSRLDGLRVATGTLEDADAGLNEALTFTYEVESANNTLNVVKTDPDVNVPQESLKRVVLTFNAEVYDYDTHATVNVTDSSGAVVATGMMNFTEVWEEVLISFNKEISTPGKYTVTVPENTIYGNGTYNPEINLTYTIGAESTTVVAYEKNDGTIGLQEIWATPSSLQMADLSFIWKANVVGTDSVRLQNVASKKYLDATYTLYQAYTTTEEGTTFRLTATEGSYYNLSDTKDLGFPYMHADASRSYVVRWEGASNKANQWQFVEVDAELVAPLLAQQDLNVELKAKLALLNEKIYQPIVEDFSNHGLLKSTSQLSTNKQETIEGHISNLLDGDGNTYFHSTWSSVNTDNAYHFIQADLKQTVDSITVKYVRRNHSYNDSPKSIRVFATNNPAGDWDEIAVLESPTLQSYFGIIFCGGTLNFNLGNKYRYVRFVVEETHSGSVTNDNLFFSWSEFGIWDNNGEEFLPEDKRTEINNVIATAKQELKDLAATQSTIDQLVEWAAYVDKYVFLTDGEDYTNATEQETERITYTREFKNTQWQSWYVPFDMDYNDVSDEYIAACLNDIHEYDDDEDGILDRWTMEVLILRPGETIYANLPYVIRAKEVGEKQFVVENTMLYPADEQSMDCSSMRMHYTFTGNYSPIEAQVLRDNGWLAMGNGRLVTPTTTSTLKANRWYLESTPRKGYGSTYQAPKRIELVVVDENGEVTGVEELPLTEDENAVWPADVYDLNGRLVKAQAKNLEDLPKGVYVVNGQKWVK